MTDCMTLETCDPERITIGLWLKPMSGMAQVLWNTKYTIAQKITSCLGANPLFLDPLDIWKFLINLMSRSEDYFVVAWKTTCIIKDT